MPFDLKPFPVASYRRAIWEMLVRKDVHGLASRQPLPTTAMAGKLDLDQSAVPAKLIIIKPRRKIGIAEPAIAA
ncbi:hypothetical protein [Rhizobium laguerreae]|uniref:hypothetical protein n=1 Tax=Rhizobium laguerreae TaxID=1076926 RepID=UPI001C9160AD|nr:hypothetical protein [Rhizobium laguerreae]MBY3137131.1 hypothetical protein [Rhizobium laguerreae]